MSVGERLRETRREQRLSLQQVADRAEISVATLSRIETSKQGLDLNLFLLLIKILHCRAEDLLYESDSEMTLKLRDSIGSLNGMERARLWRRLAADVRTKNTRKSNRVRTLALHVEELLAQLEFLRAEIQAVSSSLKRNHRV